MSVKFSEFDFHPTIAAGIEKQKYTECTPVQAAALPHIMEGHDLSGLAQTGTGKTAAFLLPLMNRIVWAKELGKKSDLLKEHEDDSESVNDKDESPQPEASDSESVEVEQRSSEESPEEVAESISSEITLAPEKTLPFKDWKETNYVLVLVPTRELAEQVYDNVKVLGGEAGLRAVSIYGGTSYDGQKKALNRGVQFIVATPGRLIDLYKDQFVDLNQVRAVVFDEADRMFDMGFKDDMKYILKRIPRDRQFLVFSATLNFDVLNTAYEFGAQPIEIDISKDQAKAENVKDELFHVGHNEKPMFLLSLLKKYEPRQAIIFSNFKKNVERIAKFLSDNEVYAMGISSLLTQAQRNRVMEQFKADNNSNILVATDVAARGLDVKGVDMVINFELPDDPENYVHRIGRTGRAQEQGHAYSLAGDRDVDALGRIENYLGHKIEMGWLDDVELAKDFKEFPREFRDQKPRREGGKSSYNGKDDRKRPDRKRSDRPKRHGKDEEGKTQGKGKKPQLKKSRHKKGEGKEADDASAPTHRDRKTGRHGAHKSAKGKEQQSQSKSKKRRRPPPGSKPRRHQKGGTYRPKQDGAKPAPPKTIGSRISGFIKNLFS